MTNEQYHSDTSHISKSGLDKIESSPLDYWWHYLRPEREKQEPTKAMLFGTAVHLAVLEPKEFQKTYVLMPAIDKRTTIGKAEFASLTAMCEANNQILIDVADFDTVRRIRDAIFKHPTAKQLFQNGLAEQTFMFNEPNTGARCKIRPDWLEARWALDAPASVKSLTLVASSPCFMQQADWPHAQPVAVMGSCRMGDSPIAHAAAFAHTKTWPRHSAR